LDEKQVVSFFGRVQHPDTWEAIFYALQRSDYELRLKVLTDINATLHQNAFNAMSLQRGNKWQTWVLPLLTDLRKDQIATDPPKLLRGYTMNVLIVVLFEYFLIETDFEDILYESLDLIRFFGGYNDESQDIGRLLLTSFVNKVSADPSKINYISDNFLKSEPWQNFLELSRVVRTFVFQTAYWSTDNVALRSEDAPNNRAKSRRTSFLCATFAIAIAIALTHMSFALA
jgi:hypothetical protein